jgi:hypothetical protein
LGSTGKWRSADNMIGRKALDRIADVDPVGPWLSFSTCIRGSLHCNAGVIVFCYFYLFIIISPF